MAESGPRARLQVLRSSQGRRRARRVALVLLTKAIGESAIDGGGHGDDGGAGS